MSRGYEVVAGIGQFAGRDLRRCSFCVMDESDPDIVFDESGVCNHCKFYFSWRDRWLTEADVGAQALDRLVDAIKKAGKGRDYDCLIGVSGGVDSSYVAWKVKELGLRPLAVHIDNGWNSELAVSNIEKLLKKLDIDLVTEVLDWREFRDLQLSFLKASTPDSEVPTDHAIRAVSCRLAMKHGIRYLLRGVNARTEAILPASWSHGHGDWRYISGLQKQFGKMPLKRFPHLAMKDLFAAQSVRRLQLVNLLDFVDYSKAQAIDVLQRELEWRPYGGKHFESIYTRFFQGYILPNKFGYDKRLAHLSCLICCGEITRAEALVELEEPPYDPALQAADREFVSKKLGITVDEFDGIMAQEPKGFQDYPSYERDFPYSWMFWIVLRLPRLPQFLRRKIRGFLK